MAKARKALGHKIVKLSFFIYYLVSNVLRRFSNCARKPHAGTINDVLKQTETIMKKLHCIFKSLKLKLTVEVTSKTVAYLNEI